MPDTNPTEEQQQKILSILSRWNSQDATWSLVYGMGLAAVMVGVSLLPINFLVVEGSILLGGLIGKAFLARSRAKGFVRRLSKEDRETVQTVLKPQIHSFWFRLHPYGNLQKACQIESQNELLRPSQQPQDDTLLRAAHSTDTTPQDQLLRPVPSHEE